tara:strand:+ start:119 stop:1627 length:1509 start_codon:yes stop_codon:yes gene_type:complete
MVDFRDISLAFDDIIDTPAKRRRQVEEASQQIRNRYDQSGHPFSVLAGGIAGSIPGITENFRRGARDMGGRAFQTQGEGLAEQLRGIDTSKVSGQNQVLAIIDQVDPGRAQALKQMFDQKNIEAEKREFEAQKFQFQKDQFTEDKRAAGVEEGLDVREMEYKEGVLDQQTTEWLSERGSAENRPNFYQRMAQEFADNPEMQSVFRGAAATNAPSADVNTILSALSTNGKKQDKERFVNQLMVQGNMTRVQAQNMNAMIEQNLFEPTVQADGTVIMPNMINIMARQSGNTDLTEEDMVLTISPAAYEVTNYDIAEEKTLYALHEFIPGLGNWLVREGQKIYGQMEPGWIDLRRQQAQNTVNTIMTGLRAAAREEMGAARLSTALVDLIDGEIGLGSKAIDVPELYLTKLRTQHHRLKRERLRIEGMPTSTPQGREQQIDILSRIDKAIQEIGIDDKIIAPSELSVETVQLATEDDLRESIAAMPDDAYTALSQDIKDALERRL